MTSVLVSWQFFSLIVLWLIETQVFIEMSMPKEIFRIRHRHFFLVILIYLHPVMTLFSRYNRNENEGFNRTLWNWNLTSQRHFHSRRCFNRTLWNWNYLARLLASTLRRFNRTLWNWNFLGLTGAVLGDSFNRTLWNWNIKTSIRDANRFMF